MSLYDKYANEADFRDRFVRPLLNRLGFYGVVEQHGANEFGKDFVFSELHRLGGIRHYAAQVKHDSRISQGAAVDGLLSQIKQAFSKPFRRPDSPRECHVSSVYVFSSGEITDNAKEQMLAELQRERYGDNVHFLDGQRLEALAESCTLASDRDIRAKLVGLRLTLQANAVFLTSYGEIQIGQPLESRGFLLTPIEIYMASPILDVSIPLHALCEFWQQCRIIEACAKSLLMMHGGKLQPTQEQNLNAMKDLCRQALNQIQNLLPAIDAALHKLKPLI